jgi:hypothetical protein
MANQFQVTWIDRGARRTPLSKPRVQPDPAYPQGIDLDVSAGQEPTCVATLPYPAKRIGFYQVECRQCGYSVVCTTAGRVDDPRSIRMACKR